MTPNSFGGDVSGRGGRSEGLSCTCCFPVPLAQRNQCWDGIFCCPSCFGAVVSEFDINERTIWPIQRKEKKCADLYTRPLSKVTPVVCDGVKKIERGLNAWIYEMTSL